MPLIQPHPVAYQRSGGKLVPFFLIIDGIIIEVGNSSVTAVDLFKPHYDFSLHFDLNFDLVYKYLQ